jgi:hypothetical protein
VTARLVIAAALLGACVPPPPGSGRTPPADPFPGSEADDRGRLRRELEAEILDGYSHDQMVDPEAWIGVADPLLGLVRIGTGPEDFLWTRTPETAGNRRRWPLGDGWARTKMLELHMTEDGSVAWTFDEVSWRLDACGRTAAVPLRVTALHLRDGERWVPVMEHISYAQPVGELIERGRLGPALGGRVAPPAAGIEAGATVERALTIRQDATDRVQLFSSDSDALVLWPDPAHELRGAAVTTGPTLADSFDGAVSIEGYRVGVAGGAGGTAASIAWWAGTLIVKARRVDAADAESSADIRLRATVVAARDGEVWRIVQAHVSAPIRDEDLGAGVFGAARQPDGSVRCDGPLPTVAPPQVTDPAGTAPPTTSAPAAVPPARPSTRPARPAASPRAAGNP